MVTDGRPGNRVQAEGLARAITALRTADMSIHDVEVNPFWRRLALHVLPRGAGAVPQADLVIGAGRRGNLVAATARRRGAKAVAILTPPAPLSWFDAVVVPEHDGLTGPNVLTTLGSMNTLTPARIAKAARALPPLPERSLVALIGGPSKSARFDAAGTGRLLSDLARFAASGYALHATPSRRTPPETVEALRARFPDMVMWDGATPNPYPGWLHSAAAILVTRDSVNMASEAAATGLPVFVSDTGTVAPKFERFHTELRRRGITRDAAEGPAEWTYPPLDEAARIAPLLLERLGL